MRWISGSRMNGARSPMTRSDEALHGHLVAESYACASTSDLSPERGSLRAIRDRVEPIDRHSGPHRVNTKILKRPSSRLRRTRSEDSCAAVNGHSKFPHLRSRLRNSWGLRLGAVINSPGEHPFALDRRLDAGSGGPTAREEEAVGRFRRVGDRPLGHRWVTDAHGAPRGVAGGALVMSPDVRAGRR